jgi:hypothetical protein
MKIQTNFPALKNSNWQQYLVRFIFGGSITALAGIIARHYGPSVGGLFLAFPAIFPAAATLLEKNEKKKARAKSHKELFAHQVAGVDAAGAAMGSIGLMAFAIVLWRLLPHYSAAAVLAAATLLWFVVSFAMWLARKTLWHWLRARYANRARPAAVAEEISQTRR